MFIRFVWAKHQAFVLGALGLLALACSGIHHDCYETRDCPDYEAPIDSDPNDGWWNSGGNGQADRPQGHEQDAAGAAGSSAMGEGGSSSAMGEGGSPSDRESPRVLRVSPSDGARGVAQDSRIVIAFTRPMDVVATEAAYESSELPAAQVTFTWDEAATTVTLTPHVPLRYATNPEGTSSNLELPALTYHYGFSELAKDRTGQALSSAHFTFSTLRQVSLVLSAQARSTGNWTDGEAEGIHNCLREPKPGYVPTVCVGDDLNNVRYSGLLSFDLSPLPDTVAQFPSVRLLASAVVHGAPDSLGPSWLEHVAYGELGEPALAAPPCSAPSPLFVAATLVDQARLELNLDVTGALANDYANRTARANRSQYRLGFAKVLANAHWDDVEMPTSSIRLALSYLVP